MNSIERSDFATIGTWRDDIKALSAQISNQDLQLFYHIVINGSKELPLAPSEEIGFEIELIFSVG
jgi:DNA polymerase III gamma/tau subunit